MQILLNSISKYISIANNLCILIDCYIFRLKFKININNTNKLFRINNKYNTKQVIKIYYIAFG